MAVFSGTFLQILNGLSQKQQSFNTARHTETIRNQYTQVDHPLGNQRVIVTVINLIIMLLRM